MKTGWITGVWWFYYCLVIIWSFVLVGVDHAGDPLLVLTRASVAQLTVMLAFSVVILAFLFLATATFRRRVRSSFAVEGSRYSSAVIMIFIALSGGLAIISAASLPVLFTSSAIAFDAVSGQPDFRIGWLSYLIYGTLPVGLGLLIVAWIIWLILGRRALVAEQQ